MIAVLIIGAALVVMSNRRQDIHKTDTANVQSLNALLVTRGLELTQALKDLQTVTSEYKALAQVNVKEMVNSWQAHTASRYYIENADLRATCEELRVRLARHERV